MMVLSYSMFDFQLFYDGAVDIQILAPLTRSRCKVSDTKVTVKACGPLVFKTTQIFSRLIVINLFINDNLRSIYWAIEMHYISDQFQHISDSDERDHVEVSPESGTTIQKMSERIRDHGGRALIIDYGHDGSKTDTFRVTWWVYCGYSSQY